MSKTKYSLRYLPLFYDDLAQKVNYIAETLHNPAAACKLLDNLEKAILERLPVAEAFEQYNSARERTYPYYRIYVGNFVVYYVVIAADEQNKIMEVRRLLYRGQNRTEII